MNEHKQDVWKPEMKQTGIHFVFPQLVGKQMSGNDFQPKTVNIKFSLGKLWPYQPNPLTARSN